jgi:hypothetical protein
MSVVIGEVQVEFGRGDEREGERQPERPAPRGRPALDPNEVAAVLRKQHERLERLWAD